MIQTIGVIGCGMFGHALGLLLTRTYDDIELTAYDIDDTVRTTLRKRGHHPYFHKEFIIPPHYHITDDAEAAADADLVILAVPAQYMRGAVEDLDVLKETILLNVSKALERETNERMSEIITTYHPDNPVATLAGGMIAADVAHGRPVGADIGCTDDDALASLRELFMPTTVHVDTTNDVAGVEYGSAFKNVISIGAGIVDGLDYGISAKSFFVAQTLREVELLAVKLGAAHETFHTSSNSWIGDLMTSCFGDTRNRYFGELIGKGHGKDEAVQILEDENKHAEGVVTLDVVHDLMAEMESPFIDTLFDVVHLGDDPAERFKDISLFQYRHT
jgi:glycerol-3-phosphate dehydrogenase (NAD(P)+)